MLFCNKFLFELLCFYYFKDEYLYSIPQYITIVLCVLKLVYLNPEDYITHFALASRYLHIYLYWYLIMYTVSVWPIFLFILWQSCFLKLFCFLFIRLSYITGFALASICGYLFIHYFFNYICIVSSTNVNKKNLKIKTLKSINWSIIRW